MFTQNAIKSSRSLLLLKNERERKKLTTKSKRQKLPVSALNERGKFGANCGICKKRQIKVGRKYQYPKQIRTTDAEKNLKEAAKLRKDQALLLEIHEVDLIAKEFKNHEKCYRDYPRIIYPNENQSTINDKGHFKAICSAIDHEVLSF